MIRFQNDLHGCAAIDTTALLQVRSAGVAVGGKPRDQEELAIDSLLQVRSAGVAVGVKSEPVPAVRGEVDALLQVRSAGVAVGAKPPVKTDMDVSGLLQVRSTGAAVGVKG